MTSRRPTRSVSSLLSCRVLRLSRILRHHRPQPDGFATGCDQFGSHQRVESDAAVQHRRPFAQADRIAGRASTVRKLLFTACAVALLNWGATTTAFAQETFCDASVDNCRVPLVSLIDNENVGIDMGAWVIKDARIPAAIERARARGVPVRLIMDTRANASYSGNAGFISDMINAGVQMRNRTAGDICHWKLMIFLRTEPHGVLGRELLAQ